MGLGTNVASGTYVPFCIAATASGYSLPTQSGQGLNPLSTACAHVSGEAPLVRPQLGVRWKREPVAVWYTVWGVVMGIWVGSAVGCDVGIIVGCSVTRAVAVGRIVG